MTTTVGSGPDRGVGAAKGTKPITLVEVIATVALALSTIVALTAVSIGIARADAFGSTADAATAPLAIAFCIGLALSAIGGMAVITSDGRNARR
jgi:hypothetical protein